MDRKENELSIVSDFQYVRVLDANGNSVLVSRTELKKIVSCQEEIYLNPGEEIETYTNLYGLYQVDDYNSGSVAIYLANFIITSLIHSIGEVSFGTVPGEGVISLFKKGSNTSLFLSNNTIDRRAIGFKKL